VGVLLGDGSEITVGGNVAGTLTKSDSGDRTNGDAVNYTASSLSLGCTYHCCSNCLFGAAT
jgi:hypothetical protein